jgi:hypothetical protein
MHAAPAIEVRLSDEITTRGEALLTSSTSDEQARESDALRGSFFTHHLVSGLRGAADRSNDGRVTLAEAYDYAYGKTVAQARGGQHPTFKYDLAGRGDVVLTSLSDGGAWLSFGEDATGLYYLFSDDGTLLGDIDVGGPLKVAVAPGRYELRKRTAEGDRGARVVVSAGEERRIHGEELLPMGSPWVGAPKEPAPPTVVVVMPPPEQPQPEERARIRRRNGLIIGLVLGSVATVALAVGLGVGLTRRDEPSSFPVLGVSTF